MNEENMLNTEELEGVSGGVDGGAIYVDHPAELSGGSVTFQNNASSHNGGAIYSDNPVTISGTNITFQNDQSASYGGAIYSDGRVDISGITFNQK